MFDFENLEVYKKAKAFNAVVYIQRQRRVRVKEEIHRSDFSRHTRSPTHTYIQLCSISKILKYTKRPKPSMLSFIAEGSSRSSKADRKDFPVAIMKKTPRTASSFFL